MVGDSLPHDIEGALRLGMRGVLVARSGLSIGCAARRAGDPVAARAATAAVTSICCLPSDPLPSGSHDARGMPPGGRAREGRSGATPTRDDVVPPPVLIVSVKRGGILLGAFDDGDAMKGFVYSMPGGQGRPADAVVAHAGRRPATRATTGLGLRLKLAQRERALAMGIDLIEWTFDPLQALNAHLNFAKLGVVVEEYEENIYGVSSSPLHSGSPTDRFVAVWRLTDAARRAAYQQPRPRPGARCLGGIARRSSIRRASGSVAGARSAADLTRRCAAAAGRDSRRQFHGAADSATRARRSTWRMATRAIFQTLLRARLPRRRLLPVAAIGPRSLPAGAVSEPRSWSDSRRSDNRPVHPGGQREPPAAEQMQVDVEHGLAGVGVGVEHRAESALGVALAARAMRGGAPDHLADQRRRRPASGRSASRCAARGTTSACSGACGLMSLKATTRSSCRRSSPESPLRRSCRTGSHASSSAVRFRPLAAKHQRPRDALQILADAARASSRDATASAVDRGRPDRSRPRRSACRRGQSSRAARPATAADTPRGRRRRRTARRAARSRALRATSAGASPDGT